MPKKTKKNNRVNTYKPKSEVVPPQIRTTKRNPAREAVALAAISNQVAVLLNGGPAVVSRKDAERMEATGVSFAYLCDHKGTVVAVPAE